MDVSRKLNYLRVWKCRFRRKSLSWLLQRRDQLQLRIQVLEEVINDKQAQGENNCSTE